MKLWFKYTLIISIILLSMTCFIRCHDFGLINLDDYLYLTMHDYVCEWQGIASLNDFFSNVSEGIWMPLTWLSYAVDYLVFGDWFGGFHLHSLFLHFLNAILLYYWLLILFSKHENRHIFCLIGTLAWTVHPLRCESVVFLASRKDILSFFWELLALIFWTQATATNQRYQRRSIILTVSSYIAFIIGSMCKPSVMTFPALCLLTDIFVVKRVYLLRYIFPLLYMFFLGGFAIWQQSVGGAIGNFAGEPFWNRLIGASAAFGIYIRNFIWPQWLAPQCLKIWPELPRFWIPGMILSGSVGFYLLSCIINYWKERHDTFSIEKYNEVPVLIKTNSPTKWLFIGLAWFSLSVAPMLGIIDFGFHAFADRFTYIPSIGLSFIIIAFLYWLSSRIKVTVIILSSSLVIGALMCVTWKQTGYWKDDKELFSRTLEVDGDHNAGAHCAIANWHFEFNHDNVSAISCFKKAMAININYVITTYPIYAIALSELGMEKEIASLIHSFEHELTSKLGKDKSWKILSRHPDIDPRHQYLRTIYLATRIAWMLSSQDTLSESVAWFNMVDPAELSSNPFFIYLQLMYYKQIENFEQVKNTRAKICTMRKGFHRFRFLHREGN